MLVKMISNMSGPDFSAQPGQEIDLPRALADELISGGYAVPVRAARIEVAQLPEVEKAVIRVENKPVNKGKK